MAQGFYSPADNIDQGGSVTMVWNLPGIDLTSITALRYNRTYLDTEISGSNVPFVEAIPSNHRH